MYSIITTHLLKVCVSTRIINNEIQMSFISDANILFAGGFMLKLSSFYYMTLLSCFKISYLA